MFVMIELKNDLSSEDLPIADEELSFSLQLTYIQDDGTSIAVLRGGHIGGSN